MEILWETREMVITPEEVVERINKLLEEWAAEEKEEAEQKEQEGCAKDAGIARESLYSMAARLSGNGRGCAC